MKNGYCSRCGSLQKGGCAAQGCPLRVDGLPVFAVSLHGFGSVVRMDGVDLRGVRDVKVHQPADGPPIVTVEFVADKVIGIAGDI